MKKGVIILMLLTIGLLNKTIAAESEAKKIVESENKTIQMKEQSTEAKKLASLCGFDINLYTLCGDGSLEPSATIHIVYWCETGVVNLNLSWVVTVSPSIECLSIPV